MMPNVATEAITQLTAAGSSGYKSLGDKVPVSASVKITIVNPASLVLQLDYSADGAGAADASTLPLDAISTAGVYVVPVSITNDYPWVRLTWSSGTADSVDAVFQYNQVN